MRFAVAADHAGVELKRAAADLLGAIGHDVVDLGGDGGDPHDDYPDVAARVGDAIRDGRVERAVLVCGSGVGASVAANKIPSIRAGLCHDTYSAHQGVEHDDVNVLVLGARVVGVELARDVVRAFAGARFSGEDRHVRRVGKIAALEARFAPSASREEGV